MMSDNRDPVCSLSVVRSVSLASTTCARTIVQQASDGPDLAGWIVGRLAWMAAVGLWLWRLSWMGLGVWLDSWLDSWLDQLLDQLLAGGAPASWMG